MEKTTLALRRRVLISLGSVILLFSFVFLVTACRDREITNFPDAIEKYGYKSSKPLSGKETPVENNLLGGYVYNSLPLILSKKDNNTYLITFLSTETDRTDEDVEAHMTVIGNSQYLNLNLGGSWAFLKVISTFNNSLQVKLLRNTIEAYVKDNLRNWLIKNGEQEDFQAENNASVSIYYMFAFDKITPVRAKEIQAEQLLKKKTELLNSCSDYNTYAALEAKYPNDPMLQLARQSLFNKCTTAEDYTYFMNRFPGDALSDEARKRIGEINIHIADSIHYINARRQNTIPVYEQYISECSTPAYKDSARSRIIVLVNAITKDQIEWKRTSGQNAEALQYIYYKIDYTPDSINKEWVLQHLTDYCLTDSIKDIREKGLTYIDKLALREPSKNELLDLYLSKGFLLWSLGKYMLAMDVFKSKIDEVYTGNQKNSFRKKLKSHYKTYKKMNIIFPNDKETWKAIRKL